MYKVLLSVFSPLSINQNVNKENNEKERAGVFKFQQINWVIILWGNQKDFQRTCIFSAIIVIT